MISLRRLSNEQRRNLQGGVALSSLAMGLGILISTIVGVGTSLVGLIAKYIPADPKPDNSWAKTYNTSSGNSTGITMHFR